MRITDSLLDETSSQFTVADVWTFGAGIDTLKFDCGLGESLASGVCRCNPNFDGLASRIYGEAPVSAKSSNFAVDNLRPCEWINNGESRFLEDNFWAQPNQIDSDSKAHCDCNICDNVFIGAGIKNALSQKNCQEQITKHGPSNVGFWAKDIVHSSIITGVLVSPKEVSND